MRRRVAQIVIAAALVALALAASAQAAQIRVDRGCYPGTDTVPVKVTGEGYVGGEPFMVLIDGGVVSSGTADAAGNVAFEMTAPPPPERGKQAYDAGYKLEIKQGPVTSSTQFRTAQVFSDFNPGTGDLATLRVRFSAFGFGLATPPGGKQPEIFVHYIDPKGKARKTISLGRGNGPCGSIRRTAKRRLFPFRPSDGTWALQFDTQRRYVKGTPRSRFVWDRLTFDVE